MNGGPRRFPAKFQQKKAEINSSCRFFSILMSDIALKIGDTHLTRWEALPHEEAKVRIERDAQAGIQEGSRTVRVLPGPAQQLQSHPQCGIDVGRRLGTLPS